MAIASTTGLATGISWASVVDQLIAWESRPLVRIQEGIKAANADKTAWDQLGGLVKSLRTANDALRFGSAFQQARVVVGETASGLTPLTASAQRLALPGTYEIEVLSLARAEVMASQVYGDATAMLGLEGSFELNGVSIFVEATDSLEAIRDKINAAGAGVRASVLRITDGSYQLLITSEAMGSSGISYVDGVEGVGVALGLTVTVEGEDAQLRILGSDEIVRRSTNTISDVIDGVVLNLKAAAPGETVTVTVEMDVEAIAEAVRKWVDAYNAIQDFVTKQRTVTDGSRPALHDDAALLRMGMLRLREALGDELWQFGIEMGRDGKLKFDQSKFTEKYGEDPAAVQNALKSVLAPQMEDAILAVAINADSVIESAKAAAENRRKGLEMQEARWQARMEYRREALLAQFAEVERLISMMQAQMASLGSLSGGAMLPF